MNRFFVLFVVLTFIAGCGALEGDDSEDSTGELSKSEAAEKVEVDELDYDPCEAYGWYDDGECDTFCPEPDPSCDDDSPQCSQVIAFGVHPDTGECHEFATACDIPDGWEISYSQCPDLMDDENGDEEPPPGEDGEKDETNENGDPEQEDPVDCTQVITYGVDPDTGECEEFPTPCDVPDRWETSSDGCPAADVEAPECQSHDDCTTGGCSGELCGHVDDAPLASDCVWFDEYVCYDDDYTTCGCFEGTCGWEQTDEFAQCIDEKR